MWVVTWRRIEQFLPNFLPDLFPESSATIITSPVIEQPRPKPASPVVTEISPSSSPLSQSPSKSINLMLLIHNNNYYTGDEKHAFSIRIHPPLPTPPTMTTTNQNSASTSNPDISTP